MADQYEEPLPYHPPSHETHLQRNQGFQIDPNETYLPDEYPEKIESPLVWRGEDIESKGEQWILQLDEDEIGEIDAALKHVRDTGVPFKDINPELFKFGPQLTERLVRLSDSLWNGLGFGLIRGLDPKKYTVEENIIVHVGLSSYFGTKRGYMASKGNDVLAHVRDIKKHFPGQNIVSPSLTNQAMTFHTDLGDVISIYTINSGTKGGSFRLSSSWNVYNTLRQTRPDVLRTLSQPLVFDTLHPELPSYEKPLLHYHDGRVFLQSFRRPFTGFGDVTRSLDLPPVSPEQKFALNELHFTALKECLVLDFQDGDLLVFNNLAMLHARDSYETSTEEEQRYLLKLILRHPAWEVPPAMADQWEALYGDRTNPRQEDFPLTYPTEGDAPNYGWNQNG